MKKQSFLGVIAITLFSILMTASINSIALAQTPETVESSEHIHSVPLVPIVVDGVKMQPEEISRFDGQPLYYLVTEQAKYEGVVYIFTTLEKLTNSDKLIQSSETNDELMFSCSDASTFYEDTLPGGGSSIGLEPGESLSLSQPGVYHLNENIEAVEATSCNVYTKLYGSPGQLWLACCGTTSDLSVYGWDNKATYLSVDP